MNFTSGNGTAMVSNGTALVSNGTTLVSNGTTLMTDYQRKQAQSVYLNNISNEYSNQIMTVVGLMGSLCSLTTMAIILLSKQMRKKGYLFLCGVAFGDLIENITYVKVGVARMIQYSMKQPVVYTQVQCMLEDFSRLFAPTISKGFFLLCAVDRFVCVYKPHWYNSAYPRWLFPTMVIGNFLQAFLDVVIVFLGSSSTILIPLCTYTTATTPDLLIVNTVKNTTVTVISILVHLCTMAVVYVRLGRVKKDHGNMHEAKRDMQTKVVWSLAMMLGSYSVTSFAASTFYKYWFTEPIEFQLRVGPVSNTLMQISPVCDFVIFMWRNKDFRAGFMKWICFRKNYKITATVMTPNASGRGTVTEVKQYISKMYGAVRK